MPEHSEPNPAAFLREAMPHRDVLYGAAFRLTRNAADAEDLVQETWLRALAAWDRYEPDSNCRAWLLRILHNSFINGYRRRVRHRTIECTYRGDAIRSLHGVEQGSVASTPPALAEQALGDETLSALADIGESYREVIELADLRGMRYRDIASKLGVPMGTVMSRLHRGRRRLAALLRDYAANDYGIAVAC